MYDQVLAAYGFPADTRVIAHGSGLINHTWRVHSGSGDYILQRLNEDVFSRPDFIDENIEAVGRYLTEHYPEAVFPRPVRSLGGRTMIDARPNGFYRLYPYIRESMTIDVARTPAEAFEAARQFGAFTRMLAGFPVQDLHETLPGFHDLTLRYRAFSAALKDGLPDRIHSTAQLIEFLIGQHHLVTGFEKIRANPDFKLRVTHHDTKISNVLFDRQGKGICVIDLDTVMPGYFISDVGDMFRTYLSPVSEEESDLTRIEVRQDYFAAIVRGYLKEMAEVLTAAEKQAFVYAGEFMLYMQALRFLTDYLCGDKYYLSRYAGQNYIRALNQTTLLERFQQQAPELKKIAAGIGSDY
ncbi:MAG TPA: aminoglycoside phosphotransferase family protein [Puia sp.]|nr:aminoglycoside phosphotransferase family protein [Puia sp.]